MSASCAPFWLLFIYFGFCSNLLPNFYCTVFLSSNSDSSVFLGCKFLQIESVQRGRKLFQIEGFQIRSLDNKFSFHFLKMVLNEQPKTKTKPKDKTKKTFDEVQITDVFFHGL